MHRGILSSLFALAWLGAAALGCATSPAEPTTASGPDRQAPPKIFFTAEDYDAVFDAAVRELRDAGFRVARNDRRFGVITTYPKESPTVFEPWLDDNGTADLARRSTLNHLRRKVEVAIAPADGAASEVGADYLFTVAVTLERRQQPDRYLTHSATGTIATTYRDVPAHLAQRGIPATYWEPAGEDPELAQRLRGVICERSGAAFTPRYDDEDFDESTDENSDENGDESAEP